ncbi:MAG: cyclic nucleotide-binding domain-containing protein, partial [Acidobacteria bacterium]|nr:cyclic nucleotide-binding domain-containing protein [Acidobacteriota bacterium]
MQAPTQLQDEIDALTQVAKRFSQRQLYSEAAELFHLAHELDPKNSGIKLALAEVRRMQRQYHDTRPRTARDAIREQLRRDAIDSAHFLGLAQLYAERGENVRAGECLEISKAKEPANPTGYKLMGRILARRRDYDGAAAQLTKALRFNPFDRESAEALGRAEYERRQFQRSLDATIHAFLLLNEGDTEGAQRLRRRIRTLRQILGLEHEDLVQRFHQQRDRLQIAFDRLQWHRERFLEEEGTVDTETAPPVGATADSRGLIELSGRIERLGALTTLSDDQIIRVARVVKEEFHERDSVIFEADTAEQDVFIIERGAMTLRSETSYGTFELRRLGPSSLFGESNFVTRLERAADAVAAEPTVLFRLDAGGLRQLVENDAELGVQLYWTFWHTLAAKLRAANEQMRTFFAEDARTGGPERREDGGRGVPRRVPV